MKEQNPHDSIAEIRKMMENSTRFLSLSGFSGVVIGIYSMVAVFLFAHQHNFDFTHFDIDSNLWFDPGFSKSALVYAVLLFAASLATSLLFSLRKSRKNKLPILSSVTRKLAFNFFTPLIVGVLVCLYFLPNYGELILPFSLIFYGFALLFASHFTFNTLKYFGVCQLVLGILALYLPALQLVFWSLGFGVLHIVYGLFMYFKFEK